MRYKVVLIYSNWSTSVHRVDASNTKEAERMATEEVGVLGVEIIKAEAFWDDWDAEESGSRRGG